MLAELKALVPLVSSLQFIRALSANILLRLLISKSNRVLLSNLPVELLEEVGAEGLV